MEVEYKTKDIRDKVRKWKQQGMSVGFVPTMGYLHDGHASLIKKAKSENDKVVVSIFVNPTQFGPTEDLSTYPRDFESDAKLCEGLGVDAVFAPTEVEMYPHGRNIKTTIAVPQLSTNLCGQSRPIHFAGVCLVVIKLFNIVTPTRAYFGKKDYQQYRIIKTMIEELDTDIEIIGCDIVREANGLALSSRNSYLSAVEKEEALVLSESLILAEKSLKAGETNAFTIQTQIEQKIKGKASAKIDYIKIVNEQTLEDVEKIENKILIALAVFIGKTRLIDNLVFDPKKSALELLKQEGNE